MAYADHQMKQEKRFPDVVGRAKKLGLFQMRTFLVQHHCTTILNRKLAMSFFDD